ncbi:sodium:alanine symporter family protein [Sinanaerobacter sp. ZZT-01]|uniref:alanine/glycine:cation symporter family protein n=1 Tax=Sinanaerobacter sp. ZZT-01 TaxID=3111540 RepID=UPI002D76A5AD|nr:sodium:alanine symporter family protein [Sinanaerobacter sp. ZZT-01]WRR92239.1 sodium:alanine symporter family protein [Sinanaerobacter sp. ZZT-01]
MNFENFMITLIWDYMWGLPMVVLILATGLYITIRTRFFQFTNFKTAIKHAVGSIFRKGEKDENETGVLSPMEAMSTALGTTIGVGNIGGVATAIAVGGPGAVFWMWIAGMFGMIIKMSEITLAVHYRSKDKNNEAYGGPNYYMKKGIGIEKNWKPVFKILSALFAFGFMTGYVINIQTYTVSEAVANTFDLGMIGVGIVYTIALYVMISGGLKSVGKFASKMVPFMCAFYLLGGLFIILKNVGMLPSVVGLIFQSAFSGSAAFGGFMGASVTLAIKTGMARSVFSNEAGWGSAPMIHASAKVDHPIKQGLMGIFEVFVDTFIICSITCLVILITGQWNSGLDGATLTLAAFETGIGSFGRIILAFGVFLFGLTTSSGVYAQIEVVVRYLIGESKKKDLILQIYKWTYPIPSLALVFIAVYMEYPGTTVWLFSDASTALPIFANIVALLILAPKFTDLIKDYQARYMGIGKVDPNFKIFYEKEENEAAKRKIG